MNNKKVLIDALRNLGSAKAPAVKKDVVVGSNNPMDAFLMKKGGSSMLSVKKSQIDGAGKGLFANNGFRKNQLIGLAHKDGQPVGNIGHMHNHSDNPNMYSVKQGNERYVYAKRDIQPGEELTTNYRLQPELEQPEDFMRKGGSAPRLPKKNNSKAYSRSIEATNRLFAQHPLFAKQKSRKRKIYDPNAKYYQNGGASSPEEWGKEIKAIESQIGNPSGWSLSDYNQLQNKLNNYRSWRETTPEGQAVVDYHNVEGEYTLPLPEHLQDYTNAMMKARLAYANEFGNPAAQRMIVATDQPYDFGNGVYGTHYMASMDDYAVPQIQNVNGQLILGDFDPSSREAMRFDNPDDAQYFAEHYKDVSPAFMEMELSPEEIEQYAKGGYIIEDISVPKLNKAQLGKAVSAVSKVVKPSTIKAASTMAPEVTDLIKLSQFTNNFKPEAMNIKFPLGFEGDSGVVLLKPNTKNIEDNLWHFQATMDNPMEAGKAMMLANKMFPYPNPSILEPYSLSLDSYNMLLNMGRRKDWDMAYENDVILNWLHTHSPLFEGLKTPSSTSLGYGLDKETGEQMVDRLNNMLSSKGLTEKAYLESVPGSINRIYLPNYKLTRKYQGGGLIPAAKTLAKFTPGNALRSTLYKGVNPASYNVKEKLTGFPAELFNTAVNNESRPFRVGLSLAYAPERLEKYLSTKKVSPAEFAKMPDADKKSLFDALAVANMEDVGRRRLDAWAVGLGQPQEYSTLEQIGDNKYRMVGTEYSPEFFSERMKDLQANSILKSNLSEEAKAKQLISLSEQHYDLTPSPYLPQNVFEHYQSVAASQGRPFPASYDEWTKLRRSQIDSYVGMDSSHKPWVQQRHVGLSTHNPDPSFKFSVFDNDKYGVMGGYRWDLAKSPEGIQWQSHDRWDLNPWEKRGYAYLNPDPLVKKYLTNTYFKPLQKVEALGLVGGKPFDIENNFLVDPYTFKTLKKWQNGGPSSAVVEEETYGEEPATASPMNANSYFSNWYRNRKLPFEEIGSKSYERAMKQFLPAYNPESPLLQELNTSVPYEYTEMIEGDPNNLGELVYDDKGNPKKILLKQSLTQDPEELNATIAHEERTRLWDKYRDKVLPAEQIIIQPNLKSFEEGWGDLKGEDKKSAEEYYDYLTDPNQDNIQSLIFEVRQKKGLQPTQVITDEDINTWKSEAEQSGALDKNNPNYDPALYNLFKIAKDNAALKDLFNYIASTDEGSEELQYAQIGGAVSYELGDEVDAATMKRLKKLGYTFEKV